MKNLILSAACGLDPNQIEFFLKSLRKYYNDDVLFLVQKEDLEVKQFLKSYNCNFLEIKEHKFDVQLKRYFYYLKILNEKKYKNILLCDSRDIYFQSDPFDYPFKGSINFFLEDKKIADCPYNTNWIIKTYGKKKYNDLSKNIIICSGTTLGTLEGIKSYLKLMLEQAKNYKYKKQLKYLLTFRRDKEGRGCDQAHANYIAHNDLVTSSYFYKNDSGPIATVFHLKKIAFNEKFQLINSQNKPYSIVHQYDKRWGEFKDILKEFKKTLI
tara:strand:- start:2972 stop:3778 length:807 start_codon:yes stop_codon:yes gene_type:complete